MLFFHAVLRIIPTFFNIPTPKAEGGGDEQWGNHGTLFCVVSDSVLAFNDVDSVEYFLTVIMVRSLDLLLDSDSLSGPFILSIQFLFYSLDNAILAVALVWFLESLEPSGWICGSITRWSLASFTNYRV